MDRVSYITFWQSRPDLPVHQRNVIDDNLGHVNERVLRKIVCDNTARLFES